MFYKSPTSHIINTTTSVNDYDCALVYKGEISRFEFNRDVLSVIAEDQTQLKISNKKVPYMSADRLPVDIKNNLSKQYQGNDVVVPMTFGKVDKAPTIVYYDSDAGNNMNILVDVFPTSGKYKTSKVPSLLDYNFVGNADYDYWLYTKDDDDYNIDWDGSEGMGYGAVHQTKVDDIDLQIRKSEKNNEALKKSLESKKQALKEIEQLKYKKKNVNSKDASDFLKKYSRGKK